MNFLASYYNNFGALSYAIFNGLAYLSAGVVFYLEAKRKKINLEPLLYIAFAALLGGLIGSRLGSALFVYWDYYSKNFLHIFLPQIGGKTIVGGLIGGYLGVIIAKKILKFNRSTGDLFAPGLAIGIAIGRIGCFFNGCCYGKTSNLPWALSFNGVIRHPTQIYESVFSLLLFIFLWQIRAKVHKEGGLFKIFLLIYAFFRFWIEFLRADTVSHMFGLSIAQVICMIVFMVIGVYIIYNRMNQAKTK